MNKFELIRILFDSLDNIDECRIELAQIHTTEEEKIGGIVICGGDEFVLVQISGKQFRIFVEEVE